MTSNIKFPLEIKKVTDEEDTLIKKYYKDFIRPFHRIGPHGYLVPSRYTEIAEQVYNLEVRPDDIWIVSFPRSGTTLVQELVWLIANNLDYKDERTLLQKYAYLEFSGFKREKLPPAGTPRTTEVDFTTLHNVPSPRFIKTHMPLSLLPPILLDTAKVIYVARDTRDVVVSLFFLQKLLGFIGQDVELKEYWELFKNNLVHRTPQLANVEEAWQKRNHPNMMFIFYEEMQKGIRSVIDRVCAFLGKEYTDEQKQKLAEHLAFENMQKSSANKHPGKGGSELQFIRKGKSGNWVNYFDDQMRQEAEEYMNKHFQTTDMRFPEV